MSLKLIRGFLSVLVSPVIQMHKNKKKFMKSEKTRLENVDEYIAGFSTGIQKKLEQLRATVKKAAPQAVEEISYGMPIYRQHGRLLYFAAHTNHIGFYPMITGINAFKSELKVYKWAKGSVQFPLDKDLPVGLITKITKFRVKENEEKAVIKARKRKKK